MGNTRKQPPAKIQLLYHPAALADIKKLDESTRSDVVAYVRRLNGKTQPELVLLLDPRTERKVCQWESSHPRGALRIVFAWGRATLWVIGAYVKHNDEHGERLIARVLPRAADVVNLGPPKPTKS